MKNIAELNLKAKKYIIFDLDGTLIDSIGIWNKTDKKILEEYGDVIIDLDTIQKERDTFLHNNQSSDIYLSYCEYLINKYNLSFKDPSKLLSIRWDLSGKTLEEIEYKPYVPELILKLKELGFTLILATMTTQVQLDIYEKKNKKMINEMNIKEVFDLITRKEDVKNKKPDPEIYYKVMNHFNAKKEECLVFEDSYTGVLASHNAGIECVNIYDKYADIDREEINKITDYSIKSYKEILDIIEI